MSCHVMQAQHKHAAAVLLCTHMTVLTIVQGGVAYRGRPESFSHANVGKVTTSALHEGTPGKVSLADCI